MQLLKTFHSFYALPMFRNFSTYLNCDFLFVNNWVWRWDMTGEDIFGG